MAAVYVVFEFVFVVLTAFNGFGLAAVNSSDSGSETPTRNPLCLETPMSSPCRNLSGTASLFSQPQILPSSIEIDVLEMQLLFTILQGSPDPPECVESLMYGFCLAVQTQCDENTGLPLSVCEESCDVYMWLVSSGQCVALLDFLEDIASGSPLPTVTKLVKLYTDFNCTNRSTYYFGELDPANDTCAILFDPQTQERLANSTRCLPVPTGTCTIIRDSQYYVAVPERRDDKTLFQTLSDLGSSIHINSFCVDVLLTVTCYYLFPDCNIEVGSQLVFCQSMCPEIEMLKARCSEEFNELRMIESDFADFLTNLTCSDPNTYAVSGVDIDQDKCVDLQKLIDELSSASPNQGNDNTVIIGAVVGGIGFLVCTIIIVLLVVACFITRWKTKWRGKADLQNAAVPIIIGEEHYELASPASINPSETKFGANPMISPVSINPSETKFAANPMVISPASINPSESKFELYPDEVVICDADKDYFCVKFAGSSIAYSQLEIGEIIGEGAFGKVFQGKLLQPSDSSISVAIKTIRNLVSDDDVKAFFAESLIMKDFDHPNVLRLLGVCLDAPDGHPYIVLPFMSYGNLRDYLRSRRVHLTDVNTYPKGLGLSVLMQMCIDIAQGMEYLAEHKFVHRDLAARNCMVDDSLKIKVGDFGLARNVYTSNYYRASRTAKLPVKWMPPETLHDGISNEKTDVWSFGVTSWEVFSLGRSPYPGVDNHEIIHYVSNGGRLQNPTLCTQEMYAILERCWDIRPEERPRFHELVAILNEYWDDQHFYVIQTFSIGGPY